MISVNVVGIELEGVGLDNQGFRQACWSSAVGTHGLLAAIGISAQPLTGSVSGSLIGSWLLFHKFLIRWDVSEAEITNLRLSHWR